MIEISDENIKTTDELCAHIDTPEVRENVKYHLVFYTDSEFFTQPGGRTHHPKDEQVPGGLVLHTKKVVNLVEMLCRINDIHCRNKDILVAAAIVHDTYKYTTEGGELTYHPDHADLLKNSELLPEIIEIAKMHMGRWYRTDRWQNVCEHGKLLHYADYIASRKNVCIEV